MAVCAVLAPVNLGLSTRGKDTWPGTPGKPFRTFSRLQNEVSHIRASGDLRPIEVRISGHFQLDKPLELGAEFTNVTLNGQGTTTLDAGIELSNWEPITFGGRTVWSCPVPPGIYRQLFVGNERQRRATLPKNGFYRLAGLLNGAEGGPWNEGQTQARFENHDIAPFTNLEDVELVAHHYWVQSRMRLAAVDEVDRVVTFDRKSVFRLTDDYTGGGAPYRLENVASALSEPGEWIHQSALNRVLYVPKSKDRISGFKAFLGRFPTALSVTKARNFTMKGVTIEHTEWQPPAGSAGDVQAAYGTPAAVSLVDVNRSVIRRCRVQNAGTYGIEVSGTALGNWVDHCAFVDLGGGGVKLGHGTERTTVADCVIERCGRVFAPAVGIWIGNSGGNQITHNRIHNLYYTGISVGWVWGYGSSQAVGNVIEFNDISKIGQGELSDMGAIYTLGVSPGTVITHNRISDVDARGYGGWGIYLDEGSTGIVVTDNLVQNVKTGSFHQHYGRDNMIQNNVFVGARTAGQLIRSRVEDHRSFSVEKNVIVWSGTDLLGGNWSGDGYAINRNVYWRTDRQPITFDGKALTEWQTLGHDQESIIADPLMTITKKAVTFGKGSPATKLGIRPIDLSKVGPRP